MPTDKKTIQSYNDYAHKWAKKMRTGNNIANEYLENPAMYQKLPNLKDKDVLCIGCGTGEECQHIKSLGAKRVVGIDLSEKLIDCARQAYPDLEFQVMDMEKLIFPDASFDFAYSSLTLHYVDDWTITLSNIHRILKDNSTFLFSTNHPIKWGSQVTRERERDTFSTGYIKYKNSQNYEICGDYLNPRKINDVWFDEFSVSYYHRPLADIMRDIRSTSFQIVDFIEPKPIATVRKKDAAFWAIHQKIPLFMIFELKKGTV